MASDFWVFVPYRVEVRFARLRFPSVGFLVKLGFLVPEVAVCAFKALDINHLDAQTLIFISTASNLASSPLQTMDNHEVMHIMVADLDSNSSIKKDKVILFPTTLF